MISLLAEPDLDVDHSSFRLSAHCCHTASCKAGKSKTPLELLLVLGLRLRGKDGRSQRNVPSRNQQSIRWQLWKRNDPHFLSYFPSILLNSKQAVWRNPLGLHSCWKFPLKEAGWLLSADRSSCRKLELQEQIRLPHFIIISNPAYFTRRQRYKCFIRKEMKTTASSSSSL